jgi:hypothetical protein
MRSARRTRPTWSRSSRRCSALGARRSSQREARWYAGARRSSHRSTRR